MMSPSANLILLCSGWESQLLKYVPALWSAFGRRPKTYRWDTEQNLLCSCMSGLVVMVMEEVMESRRARADWLWTEGDRVRLRAETEDMQRSDGKLAGLCSVFRDTL